MIAAQKKTRNDMMPNATKIDPVIRFCFERIADESDILHTQNSPNYQAAINGDQYNQITERVKMNCQSIKAARGTYIMLSGKKYQLCNPAQFSEESI